MATKKARSKKRPPKTVRPLDAEVFELAEKVALIFDWPQAAPLRGRLFELAGAYRNRIRPHGPGDTWATTTKWTAFLLRMILTCPRILSRPPEFEWVIDDLEHILTRRNWEAKFERDFWDAVTRVKKVMWTGHPHDKAMDYFRYTTVQDLMHPPAQLRDLLVPYSKSEAVERAIEMESKLVGRRPHERVVHRSFEKVEKELTALNALLPPESAIGPPPTKKRISIRKEHPKNTKKQKKP
jgi:hypothetical protein